ncbi:MAG: histidine kinase, partial [Ramlibacter sp.]
GRGIALEAKAEAAQRQAAESRLKLLQSQLDPHMLFNTLANLRSLIETDPPRAVAMLDRLNGYLRATLSASQAPMHPLAAEFDRLRDYLELMAIRMGPRLAYSLELPSDLAPLAVPSLLLQPVVENSIQHGLEPKVEGGRVIVSARREGGTLVLQVTDSGVGPSAEPPSGKGFGMTQVRERLATLHGGEATIDFQAAPGGGARTLIRLPLNP